jgi:Ran GTPase-activating protein (RanGAP) involved in mRNA processing and transport
LRQIEFRSVKPGAVGMQALAANPALGRLRKLALYHNKLVDKAVAALAGTKHLANLTHLDLHDNNIGDAGAEALAASSALATLRELDLRTNHRLTARGKQLLRDTFGDRVKLD